MKIYPSTNFYEIPDLIQEEPALAPPGYEGPAMDYASVNSSKAGTVSFFYSAAGTLVKLFKTPGMIQVPQAVEPEFDLDGPRALGLGDIFRRRYIARTWQTLGIQPWVNVGAPPQLDDLVFQGIPKNWSRFAVLGTKSRGHDLLRKYEQCREISPVFTLLVFGGGDATAEFTRKFPGMFFIPSTSLFRKKLEIEI